MRNVGNHAILQDKIDEAVTHYINVHPEGEPMPIDASDMSMPVQDDGGGRVTVMHQQVYPTMCRQISVGDQVVEGQWNEELLDEGRIAAIVAHLAQNQRTSHHHPPSHPKITTIRNVVDTSVILDGSIRFNGQVLDQQAESIVVDLPSMQTLPPLQNMKRCQETDWFSDKNKKNDTSMLTDSDSQVLELNPGASPMQNKQSKKSLPHKKRISKKLKRNNGNSTPQQEVVVISGLSSEQEQILPDNFVTVQPTTHHIQHEVRPILLCQICGEFYGEEQLKFFHHLKQHYEPHSTIIIENPVSDLVMDKMTNTCIVDNVATLPDSIVELSLENTVPKTMYQPIDKHILYTTSDKTLNFNTNKVQYSMASMDKDNVPESEKTDLYETLDKLEFHNCGKCNKPYKKHKQCELHKRDNHSVNPKLEDMGEFSEPEDLMAGIQVCVGDYEQQLLPTLTVTENGHVTQEHHRHWTYVRNSSNGTYCTRPNDTQPLKVLKEEEVLQRIFDGDVASDNTFADNMMPDNEQVEHEAEHEHGHENVHGHVHEQNHEHMHEHGNEHSHDLSQEHNQEVDNNHMEDHSNGHEGDHEHDNMHEHENVHEHAQSPKHEHAQENNMHEQKLQKTVQVDNNEAKSTQTGKDKPGTKKGKAALFCGLCGREFLHRNSLVYHALTHVGKQHSCSCGANFYTRTALNIHTRVHSGDKPYKCDVCGRQFRQIGDLRYHKSSLHSDKKEFKCDFCGKEFARKYSLNVHRRIHTGEKNYPCHYCNKTFRASSYRLAHMKTHTGDRPHKCDICGKFFRSAFDMRRHSQIHNKDDDKFVDNKVNSKIKDSKKLKDKEKTEKEVPNKTVKKIAVASTTTRLPILRKAKKKAEGNKKAPNVTVDNKSYEYEEVFDSKQVEYAKFKDVYSDGEKEDNLVPYKSQIYKENDEKEMATLKRILRNQVDNDKPVYSRVENTDGKMQVYTHVEKRNEFSGSIVSSPILNDMRQLDRDVSVERNDGEVIENVFLERLTALYNIQT